MTPLFALGLAVLFMVFLIVGTWVAERHPETTERIVSWVFDR